MSYYIISIGTDSCWCESVEVKARNVEEVRSKLPFIFPERVIAVPILPIKNYKKIKEKYLLTYGYLLIEKEMK